MQKYSKKDMISVYEFMQMCGVKIERIKEVRFSHGKMLEKINVQRRKKPFETEKPVRLPYSAISKEAVNSGQILLVVDDYKKVFPYKRPILLWNLKEPKQDKVEKLLLQENPKNDITEYPIGYLKYLQKKEKRRIMEALMEDSKDLQNGFTEDQIKVRSITKKMY